MRRVRVDFGGDAHAVDAVVVHAVDVGGDVAGTGLGGHEALHGGVNTGRGHLHAFAHDARDGGEALTRDGELDEEVAADFAAQGAGLGDHVVGALGDDLDVQLGTIGQDGLDRVEDLEGFLAFAVQDRRVGCHAVDGQVFEGLGDGIDVRVIDEDEHGRLLCAVVGFSHH